MTDYHARIRAKGLDSTGVTEALAKTLYSSLGSHGLAIVEYRVEDRRESSDGTHKVDLVLTQVEPSTAQFLDDHLREVMRALYRNRALADGAIPETMEGHDLRDVVGAGEAVIVRDEDGKADRVWDGNTEDSGEVSLSCPFPGCRLDPDHDGDHDVFLEDSGTASGPLPDLPDSAYPDGAVDLPEPDGKAQPAKAGKGGRRNLSAVPDPFAAAGE